MIWLTCVRKINKTVSLCIYHIDLNSTYKHIYKQQVKIKVSLRTISNRSAMSKSNILRPPEEVRGMLSLDKNSFKKPLTVKCLHAKDLEISKILPLVKKYLLKIDNFKPVQPGLEGESVIFLNPNLVTKWEDLPAEHSKPLEVVSVNMNNLIDKEIVLTYDNFSAEDIFRAVLPESEEGFSSYTKTGHIVHVNLREHLFPYKALIGKVLLDKVNDCQSVVNKVNNIDSTYRNFKMEILCGDNNMITKLKENKCIFELDFSTVYWNSRLCTEHERIVNMLKPHDVVFDVFAGVGPFSVPAAKKKCLVFANDLNPESYKWLNHNKKINKVSDEFLKTYNKDGRDFIFKDIKDNLPKFIADHNVYIIMNLPALAAEFLDAFINLYEESQIKLKNPITLFVYCFAKGGDPVNIAKQHVIKNMGFDICDKITNVFNVRTVSSMKEMMRLTIKLDEDILVYNSKTTSKRRLEEDEAPPNKKCNNGEKENEQCLQSSRSEEFKTESKS